MTLDRNICFFSPNVIITSFEQQKQFVSIQSHCSALSNRRCFNNSDLQIHETLCIQWFGTQTTKTILLVLEILPIFENSSGGSVRSSRSAGQLMSSCKEFVHELI